MSDLLGTIGDTDCEYLHDGLLAQPVNALTSLAYVAIGAAIVVASARLRARRTESIVFGVLLAGIGLGSVLFHGPQPSGSKALHDLPILLVALLMLFHDLSLVRPTLRTLPWFAPVAVLTSVVGLIVPGFAPPATFVVIGIVVALEWFVQRHRLRPVDPATVRRTDIAIGVVAALGLASWVLGRTDAPLCDPDTIAQPHGLWHLLSSIVFGLWWWMAYVRGEPRTSADAVGTHAAGSRRR